MKRKLTFIVGALVALVLTMPANADLIRAADTDLTGTGLGNVFTVLTIVNEPSETGCVVWDGSASQVGEAYCVWAGIGVYGGNETVPHAPHNTTYTISEVGLLDFNYVRIGFNANEPGAGDIQVEALVLAIQNDAGVLLGTFSLDQPVYFDSSVPGIGAGIFSFKLDAAQAAIANTLRAPSNRLGLAATISSTTSGHESFFLQTVPIPEPAAYWLIGAGLIALGFARSRRRKTSA